MKVKLKIARNHGMSGSGTSGQLLAAAVLFVRVFYQSASTVPLLYRIRPYCQSHAINQTKVCRERYIVQTSLDDEIPNHRDRKRQ